MVSGGASIGHEVTDICQVAGLASVTYAGVAGVLASSAGTLAALVGTPSTLYCHVEPPFQADVKGFVTYPLPWFGLNASATLQNRPGPQITASYTITAAQVQNLGRPLGGGATTATTALIAPGTMYGERVTQVDFRLGKSFKLQRSRIQASMDVFNLLNSSAILTQNNTYGTTAWQSPTSILQGRLIKFGAQFEF
jgi:hypothetical protein